MKFSVSSNTLLASLQALTRVAPAKSSLTILESILFELAGNHLTLTASDSETTLRTAIEVENGEGNGKVGLGSRLLLDTLKELPDSTLVFDINDKNCQLNLTSDNGNYSLVGVNGNDYPELPTDPDDAQHLSVPANVLMNAITKTVFCTGDDELRPVMNGIFFDLTPEKSTIVATDANRLVRYINDNLHVDAPCNFIFPKKPALLLRNLLAKEEGDIDITISQKNIRFTFGETTLVCRLIEGHFPNYNAVIPQNNTNKLIVDRLSLLNAVKRVSLFSNQGTGLIRLDIADDRLHISSQDIDFSTAAEEDLACSYSGTPLKVGFKAPSLKEILEYIGSNDVAIEFADGSRPGLILPMPNEEGEDLMILLMPMLINND